MEGRNNNNGNTANWLIGLNRFIKFMKRRIKLNRFLLVIDTKKGVTISAITVIVCKQSNESVNFLNSILKLKSNNFCCILLCIVLICFVDKICTQVVDLIDLLWNLSMTFGPLNSTMSKDHANLIS